MPESKEQQKRLIQSALKAFSGGSLRENSICLLNALGYKSDKTFQLTPNDFDGFAESFLNQPNQFDRVKVKIEDWRSVDIIFQITEDEIKHQHSLFETKGVDNTLIESYLFFALGLNGDHYSRGDLVKITREINKLTPMPSMLIFRYGDYLTIAIIDRRLSKRQPGKDVLQKVTLIKDININNPHRAHIEILYDLSLDELIRAHQVSNFVELHHAWQKTLDTKELNKRFFQELANWYFWATQKVAFPDDAEKNKEVRNATGVIRLITRLIFVWFLKEKGLVPDELFDERQLKRLLKYIDARTSTYYKAILQNLFFATLNTEMGKRRFRTKNDAGRDGHYFIHNVFRYQKEFVNPKETLEQYFGPIPFLNGGLFECLDKEVEDKGKLKRSRIDGFSDRDDNVLRVPDELFFCNEETEIDLNQIYGTRNKRYKVRGLIDILNSYKFTITENTPLEEEIALDPELLGKVFENLLANYNPETQTTARKQTGSFYTPREIVNYMVDESLAAYFKQQLNKSDETEEKLRDLLSYSETPNPFNQRETEALINAIDTIKVLDPACGSGAFPMGILHKLVHVLHKLDPKNGLWKQKQIEKAEKIDEADARDAAIEAIEEAFENNELDYGRKLYLIENCIYGVDIQPIAVQIAKLRFFISLIVDQRVNPKRENLGIRPLPNLETKFVAANTLIALEKEKANIFTNPEIKNKKTELKKVRHNYFEARTPKRKENCRIKDKQLREELAELLIENHDFQPATAKKIAAWDPYDQNASADFFDPEWMFGVTDGHDITIGNPPYVRADAGEEHLALRQRIIESKRYETLWEKWDLFIPFIELGYKLLKPNGVTTMIVSDAYCHSKYAQKSQEWFLKNSRVIRLDFLSKIKVFEAGVHNIICFFQMADITGSKPERRLHEDEFGNVQILPTDEQKNLNYRAFFPEEVKNDINGVPLESICYITYGLRPSSDEHEAKGEFVTADLVSEKRDSIHCKPYVEGKHLDNWYRTTHLWLEWGTDRAPARFCRPTFPELYSVKEKLLAQRSPGPDPVVCYDNEKLAFTPACVGYPLA